MLNVLYYIGLALVGWLWVVGWVIGFAFRPLYFGFGRGFNTPALMANANNDRIFKELNEEKQKELLEIALNGRN